MVFFSDHFWPLRHRFLPFDREYLENGKLQCYLSIIAKISARREFLKMYTIYGAVPVTLQWFPPNGKYVEFLSRVSTLTAH